MSRIGKKPVKILKDVKVEKNGENITVTGPKGSLSVWVNPIIKTQIDKEEIQFNRGSDIKREKALHGLYSVLVKNMIQGVSEGYSKRLELVGIGYRAEIKSKMLYLNIGFSHPIIFSPPEGIKIDLPNDTTIQ